MNCPKCGKQLTGLKCKCGFDLESDPFCSFDAPNSKSIRNVREYIKDHSAPLVTEKAKFTCLFACALLLFILIRFCLPYMEYQLGAMYYSGKGVDQDVQEAIRWYRMAAEQGYSEAQNRIGDLYYSGEGVEQDVQEAIRWYRMAAEQGHAEAQNHMGDLYYSGEGVEQDVQEAARWYRIAAE